MGDRIESWLVRLPPFDRFFWRKNGESSGTVHKHWRGHRKVKYMGNLVGQW